MGYLKYTQYVYLIFALFFINDAFEKRNDTENGPWLSLMVAGAAIFMFFFRRKFAKKAEGRKNKS
jgi:hypothetical protein